ncbi:hypothetical protein ACQ0P8_13240 [Halodesulfovibrio aestuarii]|uniref:Uncharacterized protein n=1 Tax=Halodesulfovibrio aestuarii TaxID=126333 RepID=A0A8G2FBK8_9BACT|nr:hypothetical protein [Halodesulfovibrio aestuarii]SHJ30717.1 hypothetical protein SAMN05660830_02151 [Halodesulfovibrio aestuarii]
MVSSKNIQTVVHTGVSSLNFGEQFAGAQKRILLHAAIYNRFAENTAVSSALEFALAHHNIVLQAILLPVWRDIVWMDAACKLVRPESSRAEMLEKAEVSLKFFLRLAAQYPQQVVIYEGQTVPACPLVIVDDSLFCGHYVHSQVLAPEGVWMEMTAPVESLLSLAESIAQRELAEAGEEHLLIEQRKELISAMPPQERAMFRYLQEWNAAKGPVIRP